MNRSFQVLLIVSAVGFSWTAMTILHEIGHVFHAVLSGGNVVQVALSPWEFSRTDVLPNPSPLFVAWGGAVWGVLVPIAAWIVTRTTARSHSYLAAFFAGFCCIANGAYIGAGSIVQEGDAGDMLRNGAALWVLIVYGIAAVATGLRLWNGLGTHFGLGDGKARVERQTAVVVTIAFVAVVAGEVVWTLCQPFSGN